MPNRVLYVAHNHPAIRPGGAEAYALALHRALGTKRDWESVFIARSGAPLTRVPKFHEGTQLTLVDGTTDEYYFHTDQIHYDSFYGWSANKHLWTHYLRDFLKAYAPDVVHFQHTLFLGYDMVREVRSTLPNAAIFYTLHEFVPICHRNGQMVRTVNDDELCTHSSPRRCHECFPEFTPQAFFMRERFIKAMFGLVDMFVAPSEFLRRRYIGWGIPADRILYEENGFTFEPPADTETQEDPSRTRIGFFGQLTPYKGLHVLLEAIQQLQTKGVDLHLTIHGANLELQETSYRSRIADLIKACGAAVTLAGPYERSELPHLMEEVDWVVVPSIWWENSPLVIQEAFLYGRPVICADIGGMAEKVKSGINGLHFRARSSSSLASVLRTAVTTPSLWDSLRRGIPQVHSMDDHVTALTRLYGHVMAERRDQSRVVVEA